MDLTVADEDRIAEAFFPYDNLRIEELKAQGRLLVHYTSVAVAHSILENREIWMRNAQTMNDYSEIKHGLACLEEARKRGITEKLGAALDATHAGVWSETQRLFNSWLPAMFHNTFIACVSEHLGPINQEDTLGRLSMWRAYGGVNGVALILNPRFLYNPDMGSIATSPVLYADADEFCVQFTSMIQGLENIADLLARSPANQIANLAFNVLKYSIICTKHPGFAEEKEWRVIYSPDMGASKYVRESVEIICDLPQVVQKIQLRNDPNNNIIGLDPSELIESIIIGPVKFPMTVREILYKDMLICGFSNINTRIRESNIPLRI
ncbi:MAG: hypothetical protein CFE28_09385 [Alphaproteobacteria bacterium PA2]|nr:MAG: hypothetical protein CFE28_09385 [Alphaproteobacteria bacterium PA2]